MTPTDESRAPRAREGSAPGTRSDPSLAQGARIGSGAGLRASLAFLLPIGRRAEAWLGAGGGRAASWFVPIGLLIGLAYAGIFSGAWRVWGEYFGLRLIPAAVLIVVDAAFFGYRLLNGACATTDNVAGSTRPVGGELGPQAIRPATLALLLLLLVKFALLLAVPRGQVSSPADWRRWMLALYPQPVVRPLILMALWGRWSMLLALSLGRPRAGEPAWLDGVMGGAGLGRVLAWIVPCLAMTVWYCTVDRNVAVGLVVSGVTLAAAYLAGVGMSWRLGGQTRASIGAAGAVGELAFLLAYVPFSSRIYGW